jgi:hexokinase
MATNERSGDSINAYFFFASLLQLFDHIAECIKKFMDEHNLVNQKLPLGFTFSFPCKQEGLAKARLSQWTKGFRCEGVVGEDICRLLHEALHRIKV